MVEFPRDNKERWSWASPARTLGLGPAVPGVWRGSRELSCCTEPTWSWCTAGARAGRQRWAKPRRARVPRVSAGVPRAHSRSWRWGTWRGRGVCPGTRAGSQPCSDGARDQRSPPAPRCHSHCAQREVPDHSQKWAENKCWQARRKQFSSASKASSGPAGSTAQSKAGWGPSPLLPPPWGWDHAAPCGCRGGGTTRPHLGLQSCLPRAA